MERHRRTARFLASCTCTSFQCRSCTCYGPQKTRACDSEATRRALLQHDEWRLSSKPSRHHLAHPEGSHSCDVVAGEGNHTVVKSRLRKGPPRWRRRFERVVERWRGGVHAEEVRSWDARGGVQPKKWEMERRLACVARKREYRKDVRPLVSQTGRVGFHAMHMNDVSVFASLHDVFRHASCKNPGVMHGSKWPALVTTIFAHLRWWPGSRTRPLGPCRSFCHIVFGFCTSR